MKAKACPFCGSTDLGIGRKTRDAEGWPTYVYCAECGTNGPWFYTMGKGHFTCLALCAEDSGWNERVEDDAGKE